MNDYTLRLIEVLIQPMLILMVSTLALKLFTTFLSEWKDSKKMEFELKIKETELRDKERLNTSQNINIENVSDNGTADIGGYVTIDIQEDKKSLFHDLLKGF